MNRLIIEDPDKRKATVKGYVKPNYSTGFLLFLGMAILVICLSIVLALGA